jgi:hypothetical protein
MVMPPVEQAYLKSINMIENGVKRRGNNGL